MARTKGALNKRTRAALHAAQTGELGGGGENPVEYLLRVMRDPKKPDELRVEAAKAVAPYLQPKLSAVEMTQHDPADTYTDAELRVMMNDLLHESPELKEAMLNSLLHAYPELKEKLGLTASVEGSGASPAG